MAPQKRQGRPQVRWDFSMKEALDVIASDGFDWCDATRIFNHLFKDHLSKCSLPNGTTTRVLTAQYQERKKNKRDWNVICAVPRDDATDRRRVELGRKISDTIVLLGLSTTAKNSSRQSTVTKQRPHHGVTGRATEPAGISVEVFSSNQGSTWTMETRTHNLRSAPNGSSTTFFDQFMADEINSNALPQKPNPLRRSAPSQKELTLVTPPATVEKPPATVKKTPARAPNRKGPNSSIPDKILFHRPDGSAVRASRRRICSVFEELNPVPDEVAHPPSSGLLFRFWEKTTPRNHNSENGFVARKYFHSNIVAIDVPPVSLDFTDVFNHLNRNRIPTPFISTSNRLVWVIRGILSLVKQGNTTVQVTLINPNFDRRKIFWARPYHAELVKKYPFTNGAQNYCGSTEFLIWRNIPKEACVSTFAAVDLLKFVKHNKVLEEALSFDMLSSWKSLKSKTQELKAKNNILNPAVAAAVAQLTVFMGLNAQSATGYLSHVVSDIIQGWGLHVEYQDHRRLINAYVEALCNGSKGAGIPELVNAQAAFTDGIRWGLGEHNVRHSPLHIQKMLKKAERVGLGDPASLVLAEIDAVRSQVVKYFHKQSQVIEGAKTTAVPRFESSRRPMFPYSNENDDDDDDLKMSDDEIATAAPTVRAHGRPVLGGAFYDDDNDDFDEENDSGNGNENDNDDDGDFGDNIVVATPSHPRTTTRTSTKFLDGDEVLYEESDQETIDDEMTDD